VIRLDVSAACQTRIRPALPSAGANSDNFPIWRAILTWSPTTRTTSDAWSRRWKGRATGAKAVQGAAMKDGMSIRDAAKESGCNPPPITAPKSTFKWMVA
jgi:hypothetical protein